MSTIRFFSGGRDKGKQSIASEILKLEVQKRGKLDAAERFKFIMKKKMEESKKAYSMSQNARPMSKKAQNALKQIAQKKAAKEAKIMRQMVIVQPKMYSNGRLTKKGQIYDIAGNIVGNVNKKNGKMQTTLGTSLGKYKPKSQFVNGVIISAIDKYSPYYINLRKMQAMQAAGIDPRTGQPLNQDTMNVHGNTAAMHGAGYMAPSQMGLNPQAGTFDSYGEAATGPRQNIGVTAWGAQSDNVWGTFNDNVWGTSTDNVWGGNSSDVWGGIGPASMGKSVRIWGTGSGKNYIKGLSKFLSRVLGIKGGKGQGGSIHERVANARKARGPRSGGGGSSARTTRASAPTGRR